MTTCKITEITSPVEPPTPADRTFTLTLTGQELQHLRASMGNQREYVYRPVVRASMYEFFKSFTQALIVADIPVLEYPGPSQQARRI